MRTEESKEAQTLLKSEATFKVTWPSPHRTVEDTGPQKAKGVLGTHGWVTAEPTPKLSLGSPTPWGRRLFLSE